MTDITRIRAAYDRISPFVRETPLLGSPFLDEIAGRRVLIKPECLQHTGSFKYRGARAAISALSPDTFKRGVIAYSSGNHAQGVAMAAREMGTSAVIVMPGDAPRLKIENTRALGAEVVLYDRIAGESREALGNQIMYERNLHMIRPYDDADVISGQATTGLEIAKQAQAMGITSAEVLICCGGGGLTSGIALALEADAPQMSARPCEPEGFDDVTRSLSVGAIQTNNALTGSICDAILTPRPGDLTFPIMRRLCGTGIVISDEESLHAMALAWLRLKIVAEPGGAAALAAALFHPKEIKNDTVIVVVSGGNVDATVFQDGLNKFGVPS